VRILVIGSGLMGPAAAYNAMVDDAVDGVTVCDLSEEQLGTCRDRLRNLPGADKVAYRQLDMRNGAETVAVMKNHGAGVAALPRAASMAAIPLALEAGMPYMDLTRVADEDLEAWTAAYAGSDGFVILGCGLEPGLTEIMARHLAEQLDRTDELHIQCGGIPEAPSPPLGYKIVFGGRRLPLRDSTARAVIDGRLVDVPRYSEPEPAVFEGVGECEAWHEGFMPWLLEVDALKGLRSGTQKTVRWPGYSHKVTVLRELGLLSEDPVDVDGVPVIPKHVVDAVLFPRVKMAPEDRDITTFRVTAIGKKDGRPATRTAEMFDRYDEETGFTSMARTTAFTAAIGARMTARGDLPHPGQPFVTPEQAIYGDGFDTMIDELDRMGVRFTISGS
jgi:saccharopine dehydrogenase-like NADP-dependent oxidoreductase